VAQKNAMEQNGIPQMKRREVEREHSQKGGVVAVEKNLRA
jgi:hypothetical protein